MTIYAAALALITAWAPAATPPDEPPETVGERAVRLEAVAHGVADAAHADPWLLSGSVAAAGVLTVWAAETHFDPYIHAGIPHPDPALHEDHGRARCLGSIHRSARMTLEEWRGLAGTSREATTRCALATLRALRSSFWICARGESVNVDTLARTLEQYATGHSCEAGAESRRRAQAWIDVIPCLRRR